MDILVLVILSTIFGLFLYVFLTYRKYRKEEFVSLLSGFEVSRKILDEYDLSNVYITEARDIFFSQYNYARKVIKLSNSLFNSVSLSSCAISARAACYAIEDKKGSKILSFKTNLESFVRGLLLAGYSVTVIGALFGHSNTLYLGVALITIVFLYRLSFVKYESKISCMAMDLLLKMKIVNKKESKRIGKALKAFTYSDTVSIVFPFALLIRKIIEFGKSN